VSPVRYELGFLSQKTAFFIVAALKTSNITWYGRVVTEFMNLATDPHPDSDEFCPNTFTLILEIPFYIFSSIPKSSYMCLLS
jgi:hypothetical protein